MHQAPGEMAVNEEKIRELEELLEAVEAGSFNPDQPKPRPVPKPEPEFNRPSWVHKSTTWQDLKRYVGPNGIGWDWPGWLPRRFVTIVASEPGMGKSLLCLRLAACYLAGRPWPDGTPFTGELGQVVWCEAEGSQALNLERAEAWGLDLSQIVSPMSNPMTPFSMDEESDKSSLYELCHRPEVQLVVIDSLSSVQRGSNVTDLLDDLGEMARIGELPIVITHHLRKRTSVDRRGQVDQERLRGTSRIAQAARVVWAMDAPDMTDPAHRRLAMVKNNLMPAPEPLGMRITGTGPVFGLPPVAGNEMVSQLDMAADLLFELLEGGPMAFEEVQEACLAAGVPAITMRRAKKRLGIVSFRPRGEKRWFWGREGGDNN
jgi:hypothetical protein